MLDIRLYSHGSTVSYHTCPFYSTYFNFGEQVAKIETEKLLAGTIALELEKIRKYGQYAGVFNPQFHSFG